LFGDNDLTARIPVALMGVLVVAFPFLLRRWLGRAGALVTSFLLLISPSIAYYSRYIRHDIPVILWALIIVYAMLSYLEDGRSRWLNVMAAGISLAFATKEVAFIYSAIFGLFLVAVLVVRVFDRQRTADSSHLWSRVASSWHVLRRDRAFDLAVVLGTLSLPFLSPALIAAIGLDPLDYTAPTIVYSSIVVGAVMFISVGIGVLWDWQRWWPAAAIHYAIFLVLYTTFFTNGYGIASGLVGSLGYWLKQQEVERGGQPQYYYVVTAVFYEYLPWLLAATAAVTAAIRGWRARHQPPEQTAETDGTQAHETRARVPFLPLLF
jgi:uncharacterized protein (TIGR03663 family)